MNRAILNNTKWNYLQILVRMFTGIFTFRMLYQYLPDASFGFWAFLWSILAWSILMDFGMALTVQKQVATSVVNKDWSNMNQVVASVFWLYCFLAALVMIAGWLIANPFLRSMNVTPEDQVEFWRVFIIFVAGFAVNFPAGIFPQILRGMQRLDLQNRSIILGSALNLGFVWWGTTHEWKFSTIMLAAVTTLLIPNIWMAWVCKKHIPDLSVAPKFLSKESIKPTLSFSVQAYLILISYTLMTKTDQFFIGSMLSLSAIAVYQPGAKLAEIFGSLSRQLADAIQPAAASLHAQGDKQAIQALLFHGMRISVLLAGPMYIIFSAYAENVIAVITGMKDIPPESYWTAQILCLWAFSLLITHNVFKRIAVMCGHEKILTWLGIGECFMNLGLTVVFLKTWQTVEGAALATLISSWVIGWGIIWRLAAKEAGRSVWNLAYHVIIKNLAGCLPMIGGIAFCKWMWPDRLGTPIWIWGLEMGLMAMIGGVGVYFVSLTQSDREKILSKIPFGKGSNHKQASSEK